MNKEIAFRLQLPRLPRKRWLFLAGALAVGIGTAWAQLTIPHVATTDTLTAARWNNTFDSVASAVNALVPPGTIMPYAGVVDGTHPPPTGWLVCDGSPQSPTTYAALFAAIGTVYGGDGVTAFNLPDRRGRVVVGVGTGSGLTARALGDQFGEETHTLTVAEMPSHSHTDAGNSRGLLRGGASGPTGLAISTPAAPSNKTLDANIQSTGGNGAHNNVQPSFALNMLIKQ
jgi:microcystin-dependent protein